MQHTATQPKHSGPAGPAANHAHRDVRDLWALVIRTTIITVTKSASAQCHFADDEIDIALLATASESVIGRRRVAMST